MLVTILAAPTNLGDSFPTIKIAVLSETPVDPKSDTVP